MRLLVGISLLAMLAGCNAAATQGPNLGLGDLPATITLGLGEERQIGGTVVGFAAVPSDSRCPGDVVCVWEGNAELQFNLGPAVGDGPAFQLTLNTSLEPRVGSALGLKLTVVDLAPTPVSTRQTRGYRVELRVEVVPN